MCVCVQDDDIHKSKDNTMTYKVTVKYNLHIKPLYLITIISELLIVIIVINDCILYLYI